MHQYAMHYTTAGVGAGTGAGTGATSGTLHKAASAEPKTYRLKCKDKEEAEEWVEVESINSTHSINNSIVYCVSINGSA
jgi:hypothetical protein